MGKLDLVDIDGCAVGVQSKTGEPILKPWRIAVSSPLTRKALDGLRCQGGHTHVPCSGDETARSAFYPEHLCPATLEGNIVDPSLEGSAVASEGNIVDPDVRDLN